MGRKGSVGWARPLGQADLGPRLQGVGVEGQQVGAPGLREAGSKVLGAKARWVVERVVPFRPPVFIASGSLTSWPGSQAAATGVMSVG